MHEQDQFEAWWVQDCDTSNNPYTNTSMMYWAWEAWKAGRKVERQWVGLTDEEVHEAFCHVEYETFNDWKKDPEFWCLEFCRYIEIKLKAKNGF